MIHSVKLLQVACKKQVNKYKVYLRENFQSTPLHFLKIFVEVCICR